MSEQQHSASPSPSGESARNSQGAGWRRITGHPLFWAFVAQFICLAALCVGLVFVTGALDLNRLRCIVPGQCVPTATPTLTATPTQTPTVTPSVTLSLTPTQTDTYTPTSTPIPTTTPAPTTAVSVEVHGTTTVVTMTVDAAQPGWHSSLTSVEQNATLSIVVIGGEWTEQKGVTPYNPGNGTDYICNPPGATNGCVEPMPGARKGSLIGEVGGQLFEIDNHKTLPSPASGTISLRINDPDSGLYDNDGILTVQITIDSSGSNSSSPNPQ